MTTLTPGFSVTLISGTIDRVLVDIEDRDTTDEVSIRDLRDASKQDDRDLARWYKGVLTAATDAIRDRAATCAHSTHTDRETTFSGPAYSTRDGENPAAHGNITITSRCSVCCSTRRRNVNGAHEEIGDWFLS